ncbi:MAG: aggregation factor core protein MAFp3, isoform C, partial [Verrucomicrobia bacterium]|nr:aggregation factor core protein MAFp3, isoform C [Verrucomicrobiota bacterium]
DSVIGFSAPTYSVNEAGTNAVITVTRSGNLNGTATATVVISGLTATDGLDFTGGTNVLNFAVGQTNQTFNVPIINDNVVEGDETVNLRLVGATGSSSLGLQTNAVLTIVDDDFYGRISFSSAAYSVSEAGVFATITVIRTNGTAGIVSVNFATGNGSALAGADYTATNGVLVFPDGVTIAQFAVLITNDFLVEGNETVNLTLGNVAGGASLGDQPAAVLTIVDDDFYGAFQFSTNAFVANESAGAATITVLRVGGSAGTVSVNYATAPGTATVGSDFTLTNGVLVFTNGVTSQSFNVPLFNDNVGEPDETVLLSLSGPAGGATLGGPVAATLTIVDDDSSPALSSGSYTVNEAAGVAVITVLRLGTTNNALSVDYYLTNGTATAGLDYTNVTGTINWAPGDNSPKTFNIPIINDVAIEGNETVKIILTNPQGGSGTLAEPRCETSVPTPPRASSPRCSPPTASCCPAARRTTAR